MQLEWTHGHGVERRLEGVHATGNRINGPERRAADFGKE